MQQIEGDAVHIVLKTDDFLSTHAPQAGNDRNAVAYLEDFPNVGKILDTEPRLRLLDDPRQVRGRVFDCRQPLTLYRREL